jgi:hypothetical protein
LVAVIALNAAARAARQGDPATAISLLSSAASRLPGGEAKRVIEERLSRLTPAATP